MKGKIKKFYEEHKSECIIAGATGLFVVGSLVGWKICCKANGLKLGRCVIINDHMNEVLCNALDLYKDGSSGFCITTDEPIKIDNLGKLSDIAKDFGFNMSQELTHFIAIGKPLK